MTEVLESFFDESISESFSLWAQDCSSINIEPHKIIHRGGLYKFSKAKSKWKLRNFALTSDSISYFKAEAAGTPRGLIPLNMVRTVYLLDGHPTCPEYKHGIRFIKNMKYTDLWLKDESELASWQAALSKVCIQSDFHTKFQAVKMIGKGSFARVYLVEHNQTKEKFAVKAFSKEYLAGQKKGKEALFNEIDIMRRLNHNNLMRLFEIHESQNSIYLVLELLEGGELLDYLSRQQGKVPIPDYRHIMACLLKALEYMASRRLMHRDLKPENIILKKKGVPILENQLTIVDFGLATLCDTEEYLFKRCGTPGFVAPEVVNAPSEGSVHYSPKCDIFSVGVIFYLILAGKAPFPGKTFRTILQHNKECKIDYDVEELKKAPPEAVALLKKMLEIDPTKRCSAAEALAHPFFASSMPPQVITTDDEDMGSVEEGWGGPDLSKLKDKYVLVTKQLMKQHQGKVEGAGSLEFRTPCIHGNVDSYRDPAEMPSSNGKIDSLHHMNSFNSPQMQTRPTKKDSIYKSAFQKTLGLAQAENEDSLLGSDDETKDDMMRQDKPKSRFGSMHKESGDDLSELTGGPNGRKMSKFCSNTTNGDQR